MHAREQLTALFWPDSDAAQGRALLRNTLLYLRQALDDFEMPHLIIARTALGFDFTSDVEFDLHILETAWARARIAPPSSVGSQVVRDTRQITLTQLQQAATAYRGSFLDSFSLGDAPDFDDWTRLQREVWHRRVSTVFDRLSQGQSDSGERASAIETATRWVVHDPFNESAYQRLMQLHFAAGDRTASLQAYETCRATFARELRTRPAPETEALAEHIRSAGGRSIVLRGGERATSITPTEGTMDHVPTLEVPLVGRADEYGKLVKGYHTAERGQAEVALLKGEAGIGKTRLASDLLGWAAAHGADVLHGQAFETGGRLPYQPLVEAMRSRIEQENAPDDLLSDPWLAELSRLFPELRDRYPDLPLPSTDETTARIRLFEAVVRLGQALAERRPVVLFIDDVHRADAASLDVLRYAGRRWRESRTPLVLLVSLRTEALSTTKSLTNWLAELEQDLHPTNLVLSSLTMEDMVQLVQSLDVAASTPSATRRKGPDPYEPWASYLEGIGRWLFTETRGVPLYVMETLKALLERGLLALRPQTDNRWAIAFEQAFRSEAWSTNATKNSFAPTSSFLPRGVREVIRARLDPLTAPAVALLVAGAVLGHGFTFERLCQVAALGEHDGLSALDEVLMHGLLEEGKETGQASAGVYRFTHDKIRDVVYTEAGEARRRIFHRRALEALQTEAAPPAELAHHALAAGLSEPAFRLSIAAGDDAMRLFAIRDAIAHYEQARSVLAEQQGPRTLPLPAIQQLWVQLGRAYELSNDMEQAHAVYEEMLAYAQQSGMPTLEQTALNRLTALTAQNPYELEQAAALLDQTVQVAGHTGDVDKAMPTAEEVETEWNLAQLNVYRFDPTPALVHGERALTRARQLGVPELIARCLNVLAYASMEAGRWQESERFAEEAALLFRALGSRAMEADSLCLAAVSNINSGHPHAALRAARAAHTISVEIENVWGQANSAIPLAQGLLEIGAYAEALTVVEQAVTIARTHNLYMVLCVNLILLGMVHRARLALDAARAAHRELLAMVERSEMPLLLEVAATELCADWALARSWEEAQAYALQALMNRTEAFLLSTKLTLWCETEALVRAGEMERATEDVRRYGTYIGTSRRYRIPYLRALAVLAKSRGEIDVAAQRLQEAAALTEEIGLPGELWPIQEALGDLYLLQGETEQASSAFKQAAAIVWKLADTIGSDEQRANFLASPLVERLLEK